MRSTLSILLLCLFTTSYAQGSRPVLIRDTIVTIKEFNWTFTVPAGYGVMNQVQKNNIKTSGQKIIEDVNNVEVDLSSTQILFSFSKGHNTFAASATARSKEDVRYEEATKISHAMAFDVLQKQFNGKATIDSSSSTVILGKRRFIKFKIEVIVNSKVALTLAMLSSLFKDKDVTVTTTYTNETIRKEMEDILATFTFK